MSNTTSPESIDLLKKTLEETEQKIKQAEQASLKLSIQQANAKKEQESFYLELTELTGSSDVESLTAYTNEIQNSIEMNKEQLKNDLQNIAELIEKFDKL